MYLPKSFFLSLLLGESLFILLSMSIVLIKFFLCIIMSNLKIVFVLLLSLVNFVYAASHTLSKVALLLGIG